MASPPKPPKRSWNVKAAVKTIKVKDSGGGKYASHHPVQVRVKAHKAHRAK